MLFCECVIFSCFCSLQKECDLLEVQNSQYDEKFAQIEADRRDILSYLQMLLMQKGLSMRPNFGRAFDRRVGPLYVE